MKIFVIDDDFITLEAISRMLSSGSVEVEGILSPHDEGFYKKLVEYTPDVILVDLNLAGCRGTDIIKEMLSYRELSKTPVVVMSASPFSEDKLEAFTSGASQYLQKPFTREALLNSMRSHSLSHKIVKICDRILDKEKPDAYDSTKLGKE